MPLECSVPGQTVPSVNLPEVLRHYVSVSDGIQGKRVSVCVTWWLASSLPTRFSRTVGVALSTLKAQRFHAVPRMDGKRCNTEASERQRDSASCVQLPSFLVLQLHGSVTVTTRFRIRPITPPGLFSSHF